MATFDTSEIRKAVARLKKVRKESRRELTEQAARGFVKTVISITPPASKGNTGSDAKKAGEAAIKADLTRIFKIVSPKQIAAFVQFYGGRSAKEGFGHQGAAALGEVERRVLSLSEMKSWHDSRRKANGRVMGVRGGDVYGNLDAAHLITTGLRKKDLRGLDVGMVTAHDFAAFLKQLFAFVGILASGWNEAVDKLGVKGVPAWIKRHGTAHGSCKITVTDGGFRIEIINAVKFVENVRGLERRINAAIQEQANKINRQADFLMQKDLKKAGF